MSAPRNIPLMPLAHRALSAHQSQINQATTARDQLIQVIAESQITGSLENYELSLTLGVDGGHITAMPKNKEEDNHAKD